MTSPRTGARRALPRFLNHSITSINEELLKVTTFWVVRYAQYITDKLSMSHLSIPEEYKKSRQRLVLRLTDLGQAGKASAEDSLFVSTWLLGPQ